VTNKDWQQFLVPLNQLWHQSRERKIFVGSTNEANSADGVSQAKALQSGTLTEQKTVSPKALNSYLKVGGWSTFWLLLTLIMGSTSLAGYWLLTSPPPSTNCSNPSLLVSDGEKLFCAQKAAQSGNLKDLQRGMTLAINLPKEHPLYNESQRLLGEWSLDLLEIARDKVNKGDLKGANAILRQVPANSEHYSKIQAKQKKWHKQWQRGAVTEQQFQQAVKRQRWGEAWREVESLYAFSADYWRFQKRDKLIAQLVAEREGWRLLREAQKAARSRDFADISASLVLTNRIKPATNARTLAKADRDRWSQTVLQGVVAKYKQQDFASAIALARQIPKDASVSPLAKDWLALSQASQKANSKKGSDLKAALSALRQIRPQSPLYKQAQAKIAVWKQRLQSNSEVHPLSVVM
jgi:hypothetical protein